MKVVATIKNVKQTAMTSAKIAIRKAITVEIVSSPIREEKPVVVLQEDMKIKNHCTPMPELTKPWSMVMISTPNLLSLDILHQL